MSNSMAQASLQNRPPSNPWLDGLFLSFLKHTRPFVSTRVIFNLFQACLTRSYHPLGFRPARMAIISKPGNYDRSLIRSNHSISLLFVFGKGLERIITRSLFFVALNPGLVENQQCGALSRKASSDLALVVTHDIETAGCRG